MQVARIILPILQTRNRIKALMWLVLLGFLAFISLPPVPQGSREGCFSLAGVLVPTLSGRPSDSYQAFGPSPKKWQKQML